MIEILGTRRILTIDYLEQNKITIDNAYLKERKNIKILFIDDEGYDVEPLKKQLFYNQMLLWKNSITKGTVLGLEMAKRIFEENDCVLKIDVIDSGKYSDFVVSVEFKNK